MRKRVVRDAGLLTVLAFALAAQTAPEKQPSTEIIKAKIGTMRRSATAGKGLGVYADFENISPKDITMFQRETVLVVPPDLTGKGICVLSFPGLIPTELPPKETADPRGFSITLKPGEKFRMFWDISKPQDSRDWICSDWAPAVNWKSPTQDPMTNDNRGLLEKIVQNLHLRLAGLAPGPYNFTVEGKIYSDPHTTEYHTFVENTDLVIEISQMLVIMGAILGGCLAYLVFASSDKGDFLKWAGLHTPRDYLGFAWDVLYKMASAALLSVVVTILLSRLSDTQFAIKVSVADFWGAITIGFLGYFLGYKLIGQIVEKFTTIKKS